MYACHYCGTKRAQSDRVFFFIVTNPCSTLNCMLIIRNMYDGFKKVMTEKSPFVSWNSIHTVAPVV